MRQMRHAHVIFTNFLRSWDPGGSKMWADCVLEILQKLRLHSSATLEGAFWSGMGLFSSSLWHIQSSKFGLWRIQHQKPSALSSLEWASEISCSGGWWCWRWSFAHMALAGLVFRSTETTRNENICWSMTLSFLVFISLLLGTQLWVLCSGLWDVM